MVAAEADSARLLRIQVKANVDNVAGVKLPRFEVLNDGSGGKMDMTGLGKGGTQLQACRKKYLEARAPAIPSESVFLGCFGLRAGHGRSAISF